MHVITITDSNGAVTTITPQARPAPQLTDEDAVLANFFRWILNDCPQGIALYRAYLAWLKQPIEEVEAELAEAAAEHA